MALDFSAIGQSTSVHEHTVTWRDTVLYALGIGATRDELAYVYEGLGPKVFPTYAVVPAYGPLTEAFARSGASLTNIVHGHQKVTVHRALPSAGVLKTTASIDKIYDMKRMAQVIVSTRTTDADGAALFDTEWGIIVLGEGGFGGEAPPGREISTPQRPSDFRVEETTSAQQALLYRLVGDLNPLHVDPKFSLVEKFKGVPILHGLCTYGFNARAVIRGVLGGDGDRLKHISARFSKPVWPGETLITDGWIDGTKIITRTTTRERGDAVLTQGYAEIRD